ncbi:MAG: UbiD family decarboxylase, partial [Xanthobacteraceae bacterium]
TRNGVGAKMGLDATKPLAAGELAFKRIRVPGEERVDLDDLVAPIGAKWRDALNT